MQKYGNAANGVDKVAGWITNQADVSAESLSCNYDCNLNFWGVIHKFTVWALRIRSSSSFSSTSLWWVTRCVQRLLDLGTALCHGREHQIYQVFTVLVGFREHQIYQMFTKMVDFSKTSSASSFSILFCYSNDCLFCSYGQLSLYSYLTDMTLIKMPTQKLIYVFHEPPSPLIKGKIPFSKE